MKHLVISGANVTCPKDMEEDEVGGYVKYLRDKYNKQRLLTLSIKVAEDGYVDLHSTFEKVPFERIRRITGYLVGTTDRWNEAKKAELNERVKHRG